MPRNRVLLEMQNSIASATVGVVFIADYFFSGNLYSRFPDTYRFMKFWPSVAWGAIYLAAGLIHLVSLWTGTRGVRKQILWIKGGLWFFLAFCVVYGDLYAASGWLYLLFGIFAWTCFLKLGKHRDAYYDLSVPPNASPAAG